MVLFASQNVQSSVPITPAEKLNRMAAQLAKHNLDAYFLSPEDEHLNEYLPENKKRITWLTGFHGESAPMVVTPKRMHLFVDGRFHIQVDHEVDPSVVQASKLGEKGHPTTSEFLNQEAKAKKSAYRIGYDPFTVSPRYLKALQNQIDKAHSVEWVPVSGNLVDPVWDNRPALPADQAFAVADKVTGKSVKDKLESIRQAMKDKGADILPITKLDEVAWLFNIRGKDIPYNPVLESYAIITPSKAHLFVRDNVIPAPLANDLKGQGVSVEPYADYAKTLESLVGKGKPTVWVDSGAVTVGTMDIVQKKKAAMLELTSPVTKQKAIKNSTEIKEMQEANLKASRAIVRHMAHVHKAFAAGQRMSEQDVRAHLEQKYQEEKGYYDLSFPTIPGIGANSAIIHYGGADPKQIGKKGDFYLLDSGAHYPGGTTDTTRTTVFGDASRLQKQRYTAVLKAHIDCSKAVFHEGTNGTQLDAITRPALWQLGLDFGHGTGHGVGAFLNVHEGPNRISGLGTVAFEPGMITSIEPGFYEKDWVGIRIENLAYVVEDTAKGSFQGKKFLRFEPLTYVPYEKKLIDWAALNQDQLDWLKDYYKQVERKLSPTLDADEKAWLQDQLAIPGTP